MATKRAVSLLLLATLAACAQLASAHKYHYEKPHYHYSHKAYKYTGDIEKDYSCVKPYMAPIYYKQTQKYEAPMKVLIIICLLQYKCFDYAPSPCCTYDGYQFTHACFATCLGYTVEQITIGKCSSPPPPVAAPPAPNCGSMYCSDSQQCCNSYGYYTCCDEYSSCCGDKCCSSGQECKKYSDGYGYYKYECKAPPPPPVTAPPAYNCGSYYCSDSQKCCKSYGNFMCCDKYSTCCGDQCCSMGQNCVAYGDSYSCKDNVAVYVPPEKQYKDNYNNDNNYQQPGKGDNKHYEAHKKHGDDK